MTLVRDGTVTEGPGRQGTAMKISGGAGPVMTDHIATDIRALVAATIVKRRMIDALKISGLTIMANEALEDLVSGFESRLPKAPATVSAGKPAKKPL
jgi:hypothetical protein